MDPKNIPKPKLIYTPQHHIPIGEAVKENDILALKIKKHGMRVTEVITIDVLLALIFDAFNTSE